MFWTSLVVTIGIALIIVIQFLNEEADDLHVGVVKKSEHPIWYWFLIGIWLVFFLISCTWSVKLGILYFSS